MTRLALTGTRLRDRRLLIGLRQADLARAVGVSPAYVNLIEHNRRKVGPDLLARLATVLGVETASLAEGAEGALFDVLREAAAAPEPGINPEVERVEEFAGRFPGWADLLAARQGQVMRLSRDLATMSERMDQDPFLSASLHEVLSVVTSVRATAAILAETADLDAQWQARFHQTIHQDSLRLTTAAAALVSYLDQQRAPDTALASPQEELERWLEGQGYHIAPLERPRAAPVEALIDRAVDLASLAAREMAADYLRAYHADALALPQGALATALAGLGPDPLALAQSLGVPLALVMRRLVCLAPGTCPQGLGLVACDASGTLTFRRPAPGFAMPRFGAACSLWPLYEALAQPLTPLRRVIETAGRGAGRRFVTYSWCDRLYPGGAAGPMVSRALMLVLPQDAPTARDGPVRVVGSSCRVCSKQGCAARREPSILS